MTLERGCEKEIKSRNAEMLKRNFSKEYTLKMHILSKKKDFIKKTFVLYNLLYSSES